MRNNKTITTKNANPNKQQQETEPKNQKIYLSQKSQV